MTWTIAPIPPYDVRHPCELHEPDPLAVKAVNLLFIPHADHEQMRVPLQFVLQAVPMQTLFACLASGIASLGTSHGGANEAVLDMLNKIGDASNVEQFIARRKIRTIHSA